MERKSNGLYLHPIKSLSLEPLDGIDNLENLILKKFSGNPFVVAYLDHRVLIGRFEDKKFSFYDGESFEAKYIQRLRVFNKDRELLIWRSSDGLKGRLRIDEEGDAIDVVDARQVLFGTDKKELTNGFTRIFEKRGTEIILPFPMITVDDEKKRIFLKTRNYIGVNAAHQSTYVDCRFMGFSANGKDL